MILNWNISKAKRRRYTLHKTARQEDMLTKLTIVIFSVILILFLTSNIITIWGNLIYSNQYDTIIKTIPPAKVLIVSPHQDDEVLFAGDYMIETIKNGGEVFVIYTMDGATRWSSFTEERISNMILTRETEAKEALGMIGVDENHVIFLRNENRKGLMNPKSLNETIDTLGNFIQGLNPEVIIVPAYEGGHCDHDMTNFAVNTAIKRFDIKNVIVYEGPMYSDYSSIFDTVASIANKISYIKLQKRPCFVNHKKNEVFKLDMKEEDLNFKRSLYDIYKSQNIESLKISHSGADIYRISPKYDYSTPPYDYRKTFKYIKCILRGKSECDKITICKVSFKEMQEVVAEIAVKTDE